MCKIDYNFIKMGSVRGGPRRPNTTAYFVALGGILILLAMLCCYFFYFCVRKVKELTREDSPLNEQNTNNSSQRSSYPVQPGVRDSATAMARICKQLPPGGSTVFPSPTPAPRDPPAAEPTNPAVNDIEEKIPTAPVVCVAEAAAAS